ncbi:ATP synthase F0 subunit B [Candidatus Kaiserbacteria bacterium]|nr:ATP synthase F0 subunit B [Candidatus Kaiserbacteria bacterium]
MSALFAAFGIDWRLLLVQGVNFSILLLGLWYFLYRPVMKMLKARADVVAKGVKDAEQAAKNVTETESAKIGILSKAEKEAETIVGNAVLEGKNERAAIVKSAQDRADAALLDARAQAEELQRKALAQSQKDIARIAVLAAEKILKQS